MATDGLDVIMTAAILHDTLIHLRQLGATEIECDDTGKVKRVIFGKEEIVKKPDDVQNK